MKKYPKLFAALFIMFFLTLSLIGIWIMLPPNKVADKVVKEINKDKQPLSGNCIATIYLPNGTTREFKIDGCSASRLGGYVQFQSNGKYILLEGTVVLEEK